MPIRFVAWAADNVAAAATVIGAFAYIGLRLAFVSFYRKFGITPEDVGYDYGTVLTTTLPGMALLVLGFAVPLGVLIVALRLATRYGFDLYGRTARFGWSLHRTLDLLRRLTLLALFVFPVLAVSILVWLSGNRLKDAAERARAGHPVDGVTVLGVVIFPWAVTPASVMPITKDAHLYAGDLASACAMYLGSTNGAYVLYDLNRHSTVRLPITAMRVTIGRFADGCRRGS